MSNFKFNQLWKDIQNLRAEIADCYKVKFCTYFNCSETLKKYTLFNYLQVLFSLQLNALFQREKRNKEWKFWDPSILYSTGNLYCLFKGWDKSTLSR